MTTESHLVVVDYSASIMWWHGGRTIFTSRYDVKCMKPKKNIL